MCFNINLLQHRYSNLSQPGLNRPIFQSTPNQPLQRSLSAQSDQPHPPQFGSQAQVLKPHLPLQLGMPGRTSEPPTPAQNAIFILSHLLGAGMAILSFFMLQLTVAAIIFLSISLCIIIYHRPYLSAHTFLVLSYLLGVALGILSFFVLPFIVAASLFFVIQYIISSC